MAEKDNNIFSKLLFPIGVVVLMWLVKIVEVIQNHKYTRWGIFPRDVDGLPGIVAAPFIHSDWQHLMSNSIPMLALMSMVMVFYRRVAIPSIIIITVFTGFTVWLFARDAYHVGASGVVYGLVAFLAWTGIFRRNLKSIILALVMLVAFGSYFHGIVPNKEGVSWESHLFGGLVGIFTAFLFKNVKEEDEADKVDPWADEVGTEQFFLPRDIFEKTKQERYLESLYADDE
ncbi:MAG: membrane associated rhomboid family serine protease [Saprospiraceae bacterium]|jgi:membrane associated rhomboid family serine protease|tara:strand:- start:833 stop:1522 length:690 start_codon:yes stop_codon:yes gene_type:complete